HILRTAKLQKENTISVVTSTSPLEFSLDNLYINRNKSEDPVNKLSSTNMDTSVDYKSVSMDMKTQNLEEASSIKTSNKLQKSAFANASHDMIKIGDIDSLSWSSPTQTLNYIKKFYQGIYEKEEIDMEAASQLMEKLGTDLHRTELYLDQATMYNLDL
ncbi:31990_t:CDS:2, partial [Gigaspora margarita]